jgi:DNA-binding LacI/PurR family transcriptional regulator
MKGKVTIKEVASRANVSISTVSRVLNGLDRVKPTTYRKVLQSIEELEFVPNQVAVSMIKKETKTVVMIVPDLINPFYTSFIQGVEEVAQQKSYLVFVCASRDDEKIESNFIADLISKNVDGILLVPCQKNSEAYEKISKPIVLVDRFYNESTINGVVVDNFGGAYQGVRHLIKNGHSQIALINGPSDFNIGSERYWGYEKAMRDSFLNIRSDYIKTGDWYESNGYRSTVELLTMDEPPTAIFAANNLICQGAIKAIRDLNKQIGEDISLVGFDDHELARFVKPSVTVVSRPTLEMGKCAADRLFQLMFSKGGDVSVQKNVLSTSLIVRDSVKLIEK